MIEQAAAARAAGLIGEARRDGRRVGPLPADCTPNDEADGYAVQSALHAWLTDAGSGGLIGHKVGSTTPVMQEILGIPHPASGGVMAKNAFRDTAAFPAGAFQNLGIECEIAVRISSDTETGRTDHDRSSIARHVGACMAAMEIVDNRYGDFKTAGVPLMIADDFFHAACVLGTEIEAWQDLDMAALEGRTIIDGVAVGTGLGSAVMGHPLEAVAWLANGLGARGEKLSAGQFVLCGSFVAVHWVDAFPTEAVIEIAGLGSVSARFA
jgi:2-oxo-3-hexenedioate decarboxylase/2-keto-4-pentenoate hydratase